MPNYDELSHHTFVPFEVNRLKQASVYWVNTDLVKQELPECVDMNDNEIHSYLLENFAYMVPPDNIDFEAHFEPQTKTFQAERYGSHANTSNGGGVRCGNYRNIQVKGTGKNALANPYMDFWHTHGGASLEEAIREAVWGEFFHENAPFGSARILAIIKTGLDIDFDFALDSLDGNKTPGALMLRQTVVRPAHFERATYFNSDLPFDFYRVQDNCEKLKHITGEENARTFIEKQTAYFAYLSAWMKVNRISHGAITSGNIGIDGVLIDFGTATTFIDNANYMIARGFPAFWNDHSFFSNILMMLNFYLNKYHSNCFVDESDIEKLFFDQYNIYLSQFWIYQTGFHRDFCKIDSPEHNRFSAAINLLARACDNTEVTTLSYREPRARYNIVNTLKVISTQKEDLDVDHLKAEIPEGQYASHIVNRFLDLFKSYNDWKDRNQINDDKDLSETCTKRNKDLLRLTRHEVFGEIMENIKQDTDISDWIRSVVNESKMETEHLPFELEEL